MIDFVCPSCHASLCQQSGGALTCASCGGNYPRRGRFNVFLSEGDWMQIQRWGEDGKGMEVTSYHHARRNVYLNVLYYDYWMKRVIETASMNQNRVLLELMCGEGEISRRFNSRFRTIFAIDLDVRMIESLSADLNSLCVTNVAVACADAARLPVPSQCADCVAVVGGFHHTRPILAKVLREISRVLKPAGILIGSEPANDNWAIRALRHFQYKHSALQGHDEGEDGFTKQELQEALSKSGLVLEKYDRFGFFAYPLMGNTDILPLLTRSRSPRLGSALLRLDEILERVPGIRSFAWVSLFRAVKERSS